MNKGKLQYKGIEYTLTEFDKDRWGWVFFPQGEDRLPRGGEVRGTREHVEMACMKAINRWLSSDLGAAKHPRRRVSGSAIAATPIPMAED